MSRFILKYMGKDSLPDLIITEADKRKIIGRSIESGIQSPIVSREHLIIKPDFNEKILLIKQIGKSPSALNNFIFEKDIGYEVKENDIISLVFDSDFKYKVVFKKDGETKKRKSEEEDEMSDIEEEDAKRIKTSEEPKWDSIEGDKCLVYTSKGVTASEKIAAYDLDNTLIKTVSGNVFPKNIDDWQLNMSEIPYKLKKLHGNGFKVVVFTNQAGVESKRYTISDVKKKMSVICQRIEIPMQFFVATGSTIYRKPRTGMWELLQKNYNDGIKIDMTSSFYVGDAAGRAENKILKKKKDHSCADRLFAFNLDLNFYTPEEHFQNVRKNNSFLRPEFNPKASPPLQLLEPVDAKIKSDEQELIIMIGYPASGKSYFCNTYLRKNGYEVINRDSLNSMQKCQNALEEALTNKKSCVIDNINAEPLSRKKFIDIAKSMGVKVRAFQMTTTYHHSRHNNLFRELTDRNHSKVGDVVFNTYKNKYVAATTREGFDEIVKVNCIPTFENKDHEKLYRMYLLEK